PSAPRRRASPRRRCPRTAAGSWTTAAAAARRTQRAGRFAAAGARRIGPRRASSIRRQHELERRPRADLRLEVDVPAERLRELVRDREPEARAAAVARPERPEDPLPLSRRDAWSAVHDRHRDVAVLLLEAELDAA